MKLHVLFFAVTAGILVAACFAWTTVATLIGVPGFAPFAKLLQEGYGFYGYSISWVGASIGAIWGFVEGFVWFGLFSLIYNKLLERR